MRIYGSRLVSFQFAEQIFWRSLMLLQSFASSRCRFLGILKFGVLLKFSFHMILGVMVNP